MLQGRIEFGNRVDRSCRSGFKVKIQQLRVLKCDNDTSDECGRRCETLAFRSAHLIHDNCFTLK